MKTALTLAATIFASAVYSQNLASYKTVYISQPEGKNAKYINAYHLVGQLSKKLKSRGYEVIADKPSQGSPDFCNVAFANIADTSSFIKNKVKINITDCEGKSLYTQEASSDDKEYEIGFPDAMDKASRNIPAVDPHAVAVQTLQLEYAAPKSAPMDETHITNGGHEIQNNSKITQAEYRGSGLKKINLSASQFILVNGNSSVPYATFKESGRNGIYHVTLENGAHALGYFENGKIIVEVPNGDGFRKMELNAN